MSRNPTARQRTNPSREESRLQQLSTISSSFNALKQDTGAEQVNQHLKRITSQCRTLIDSVNSTRSIGLSDLCKERKELDDIFESWDLVYQELPEVHRTRLDNILDLLMDIHPRYPELPEVRNT